LPRTRWTWLSTFAAGGWEKLGAESVEVPATLLLDGTLCEPATYYYRSRLMPVLIGERI